MLSNNIIQFIPLPSTHSPEQLRKSTMATTAVSIAVKEAVAKNNLCLIMT